MTEKEFDDFLEFKVGGLINGRYPDRPKIVSHGFFSIGPGWYSIVKDLIEKLIELGWNREICQVKEKFGGLRFYINDGSPEIFAAIREAENKSYETCEKCGEPGMAKKSPSWILTLCDKHREERIKEGESA